MYLLVDAKNLLFRAVYACVAERAYREATTHSVVVFLKQIIQAINATKATSVLIFWDAPRKEVWRRSILETYKDRSTSEYVMNATEELENAMAMLKELLQYMNCRQFERPKMEADDLIYAAVQVAHPQDTVVVSTDSDMLQIPYMFNSCKVYNPKLKEFLPMPQLNPVLMKSIIGDTSDSIPGYRGIGPKRGADIVSEPGGINSFLQKQDPKIFYRNLSLIDLSLCPSLLSNKVYMIKNLHSSIQFNNSAIINVVQKYNVAQLLKDHLQVVKPFEKMQ